MQNRLEFNGSIKQFSIGEIIQFLGISHRIGRLALYKDDEQFSIYFENGNITEAIFEQKKGMCALMKILELENGHFVFINDKKNSSSTINKPVSFILLETQRKLDELKEL